MTPEEERAAEYTLSPSQAHQLMALAVLIREGDLAFRGYEQEDEENATSLIADVAQELALQVGP